MIAVSRQQTLTPCHEKNLVGIKGVPGHLVDTPWTRPCVHSGYLYAPLTSEHKGRRDHLFEHSRSSCSRKKTRAQILFRNKNKANLSLNISVAVFPQPKQILRPKGPHLCCVTSWAENVATVYQRYGDRRPYTVRASTLPTWLVVPPRRLYSGSSCFFKRSPSLSLTYPA